MKPKPPTMPSDYYYAFAKFINEVGAQRVALLNIFEFAAKAYTSYRKAEELFENRLRVASPGVVAFEGAEHVGALGNADIFLEKIDSIVADSHGLAVKRIARVLMIVVGIGR